MNKMNRLRKTKKQMLQSNNYKNFNFKLQHYQLKPNNCNNKTNNTKMKMKILKKKIKNL